MHTLNKRFSDMYKVQNFRFKGKMIKEHIKAVDIKRSGIKGDKFLVEGVAFDGSRYKFFTNGKMTVQELVDTLIEGLGL